ncbi:MAG: ABC transporter ATP-binding protein [Rickettsiales bacterium]|nr:ABC transporter ATP-binding protein [Rickettsiales bacterium]
MQENKLPNKLLPFLWIFLKKYKIAFYSMLFVGILLGDSGWFFVSPYILKAFVNGLTDGTLSTLHGLILIFAYSFADLMPLFDIMVNYLQFNSLVRAIEDIRQGIFKYSLKQSTNFFNANYSGNLTSKIVSITNTLLSSNQQFIFGIRMIVLFAILVIILSSVRIVFGFLAIIWLVLYYFLNFHFIKKINKQSMIIQNISNNINGLITDDFVNATNIKAFSSITQERKKISSILRELLNAKIKLAKFEKISNLSIFLINFSIISVIMAISLSMTVNKQMNAGEFFFMLEIARKLGMMSGYVLQALNDSTKSISTIKENLNLITDDVEIKDKPNAEKLSVNDGKIIFKNIKFKY